jgi:hypothetical protein
MKVVKIQPVPGTTFAENKDEAREIRQKVILPALDAGDSVTLDFSAVETSTQSYIHALISEAIRRYGEDAIPRIKFKRCTGDIRQLVTTVVEYTLMAADAASGLSNRAED